jgi:predicted signal transduction protein with EAL and GGDEF domain
LGSIVAVPQWLSKQARWEAIRANDSSIRDSLTGMLNRRGAMHVVKKALEGHAGSSAMLLVDIDNLKIINDLRGHSPAMRWSREPPMRFAGASVRARTAPGWATSS